MVDFSSLKKRSSDFGKLTKAIEKLNKSGGADNRFWQPEVDKAGNGYAVIRFLDAPQVDGDDAMPWVQVFNHGFQGAGGWFIEECLTTVGGKCPVCEYNSTLWNSGVDSNKEVVRKQKRKLHYISNILVVKDSAHPENEGKVFLFKYGKKIFDKIKEKLEPQFEDEEAVNPFNFWEGANFKLKIRNVENYRNYDKSEFDVKSPVSEDDSEIERLWKSAHSLKEFVTAENFKSYDDLKKRLDFVLGGGNKPRTVSAESDESDGEAAFSSPPFDGGTTVSTSSESSDDNTMDYFSKLAAEE